jgi:uncharacterized protein (DUF1499 family)
MAAAIAAALLLVPRAWWSVNDVTTGQSAAYPGLRPRVYPVAPDVAWEVARETIGRMRRWRVVKEDRAGLRLEAELRTALLGFTDDITVSVEEAEGGGSRVMIRSRSRVGKGDLGENARSIRALQREMDLLPPKALRSE